MAMFVYLGHGKQTTKKRGWAVRRRAEIRKTPQKI
jgi:hypothetical protein